MSATFRPVLVARHATLSRPLPSPAVDGDLADAVWALDSMAASFIW
ncbi:hypothetical protein [Acidocella sp.]